MVNQKLPIAKNFFQLAACFFFWLTTIFQNILTINQINAKKTFGGFFRARIGNWVFPNFPEFVINYTSRRFTSPRTGISCNSKEESPRTYSKYAIISGETFFF